MRKTFHFFPFFKKNEKISIDTLPPPIEAGDSSSWFSDRCHGFIHGLPQFPQAWIRPCHYLFAGSCCFLQYLPYQSFAFQSLIENVDCGIDISIMLRFAMRAFPVPYPEIFDGPILISASGTCLRWREPSVYNDQLFLMPRALVFQLPPDFPEIRIRDRFGQPLVF